MQRGAHFATFDVPGGAPCWAQRARQKRYGMNGFLMIFVFVRQVAQGGGVGEVF